MKIWLMGSFGTVSFCTVSVAQKFKICLKLTISNTFWGFSWHTFILNWMKIWKTMLPMQESCWILFATKCKNNLLIAFFLLGGREGGGDTWFETYPNVKQKKVRILKSWRICASMWSPCLLTKLPPLRFTFT